MIESKIAEQPKPVFKALIPPELLADCQDAEDNLRSATDEISRLAGKIESLTAKIPQLTDSVEQAKRIKSDVLSAHAIDKATAEDLAEARSNHDAAVTSYQETVELLGAVEKAIKQAEGRIDSLQNQKNKTSKRVWAAFHTQVIEEIKSVAGDLFQQADVAARKIGSTFQGNVLEGVHPSHVREFAQRIEAEIFR